MVYVDTSAWVALHVNEVCTDQTQAWFEQQDMGSVACAEWVKTEYASALALKRRRGAIDARKAARAQRAFAALWQAGPIWLDVESADFLAAAQLCADPTANLRASDALHLAVALRIRCDDFLSLDNLMNDNAERLGFRVIRL